MTNQTKSAFSAGAGLVWRRQRILWWIFVVNLMLAAWGAHGVKDRISTVLDHSFASSRLVNGFDISALQELSSLPSHPMQSEAAHHFGIVFLLFMLLVTGGILDAYRRDESPTTREFFSASGQFFWRFFRLLIFLLLCLIPVAGIAFGLQRFSAHVYNRDISDAPGLWWFAFAVLFTLFLLMVVRLWFDMAEIIIVSQDLRKTRTALASACRLLCRNFGSLFWLYFRISFLADLIFFGGLWLWMVHGPASAIASSFLIGQILILFWLGARLWQRASETVWYQQHAGADEASVREPAPEPVPVGTASATLPV